MTTKRRSLRDFDDDAMAAEPIVTPTLTSDPAPQTAPTRPETAPRSPRATKPTPKARPATTPAHSASMTRTGIYFRPSTFDDAKSAYLIDLDRRPEAPDSIARWIAGALDQHAARTSEDRARIAGELPPEPPAEGSGFTRSFDLPDSTIAARDAAIAHDRRAGRTSSRSSFSTEAIRNAIEHARQANGGVLPPPPARLPNKPVR